MPQKQPKSWSELKQVAKRAQAKLKRESQEADRRKCRVKRGMIEEEVRSARGLLQV